jgi:hypothetical protein
MGDEKYEDDDDEANSEDEDDEDLDHDEIILGNTTDVIIALSKALGEQFLVYFQQLAPELVKYLDDSHNKSDKTMVIGSMAETLNNCTSAMTAYFNDFYGVCLAHSNSKDS